MLVSRKELLSSVGGFRVQSKAEETILSNLKFSVYGNKLSAYFFGLKFEDYAEFTHNENFPEPVEFTVFYPDFITAVKASKDLDCIIEIQEDRILVDSIPVKKTRLESKYPDTFQTDKKIAEIYLSPEEFAEIQTMIFPHVSDDENRYFMMGICIEGTGTELNFVATNGRTLAKKEKKIESTEFSAIVPVQYLPKIKKLDGVFVNVYTEKNTNQQICEFVFLDFGGKKQFHRVKCIEGTFPNYRRVIPENNNSFFEVETSKFLDTLKKIRPFVDKESKRILLAQNENTVTIKTGDVEFSVDCLKSNANFTCALNLDYLVMSINPDDCITEIRHCGESMKPVTIVSSNLLRIIMPMQLD